MFINIDPELLPDAKKLDAPRTADEEFSSPCPACTDPVFENERILYLDPDGNQHYVHPLCFRDNYEKDPAPGA